MYKQTPLLDQGYMASADHCSWKDGQAELSMELRAKKKKFLLAAIIALY